MKPTLIFLHLPKAAGTTLKSIIRRQYDADSIFVVDDAVIDAFGETGWKSVSPMDRWKMARSSFDALPENRKWEIDAVMGHMWFGWHELTPRPCTYVTILRDPIERAISHYRYMRRMKDHPVAEQIRDENISLYAYFEKGLSSRFDNIQTKFLTGDFDPNETATQTAISNLETHFSVVGLLPVFDAALLQIADEMDWPLPLYRRRNTAPKQTRGDDVSEEAIAVIKDRNALDLSVYDHVHENMKSPARSVSTLALTRFKLSNWIYSSPLRRAFP